MSLSNLMLASSETTPEHVTEELLAFCEKVVPSVEPKYVPVSPIKGAKTQSCFLNVAAAVEELGGEMIHGWIIWEGKVLWDAEFHACWKPPKSYAAGLLGLVDITPKADRENQILFLADPKRVWDGDKPVENIRAGRFDHPAIPRLLALSNERHQLIVKHWQGAGKPIPIPPQQWNRVEQQIALCYMELGAFLAKRK